MALLDVNALVALAWDTHVHHEAMSEWFDQRTGSWSTCPVSEAGFVRISSNPKVIVGALGVDEARSVLRELRAVGEHRFVSNDVSMTDADVPRLVGHRQVTDALLLTVARRAGIALVTFDTAIATLAGGTGVELLRR
jgi:toxin-antitoxin system PIN domain toxin